jgi:hypothetical protein
MSLLAITDAGVLYKDAVFAGQEVQNITRVIFRNIAGLAPTDAIDLAQSIPFTDIVHSNVIERVSALDDNAVVMSTVLGYDVGDFQYNWYGVVAQKADLSEVLIAVVQTPVQTKTKTSGPTTGNYSTKSIVWKTANIAQALNVTLSALPWQMADNTFVTKAEYDLAMAEKSDETHHHDSAYLGKTAKAVDSSKLEGKTKAQVVSEARSGLSVSHSHPYLASGGKSADTYKLEGKTKAQVVSEARSGLSVSHSHPYLASGGKSADTYKLEGKTKAQVVSEARSGLSPNTHRAISNSVSSSSQTTSASSYAVRTAYNKAALAGVTVGSNSNGTYYKYADGTLICVKNGAYVGGTSQVVGLPHAFIDSNYTVSPSSGDARYTVGTTTSPARTASTFTVASRKASTEAALGTTFNFIAVGKWK